MKEIRKNHIVQIQTADNTKLEGIVFDYENDRIAVLIAYESLYLAQKLNELDELLVSVNTHLGVKKMKSHVIDKLNSSNCIVIENNETMPVEQKREFVRVLSNVVFKIVKSDFQTVECYCINISAGGIAFCVNNVSFKIGEKVRVILPESEFEKEIVIDSVIIKVYDNYYVAKFNNLKMYDEDKIVKYVFKLIAKK